MDIKSNKILSIMYVISMILAFTTRFGDYEIGWKFQIIIAIIWIGIFLFIILKRKNRSNYSSDSKFIFKAYFIPHLIIHLYTIVLIMIGKVDKGLFTTNMKVYVPVLLTVFAVNIFGEKIYKYNCIALIFSWVFSVLSSTILKGFNIFPYAIIQSFSNSSNELLNFGDLKKNYLELHDIVLAMGYIIILFLFSKNKIKKSDLLLIFILLIMSFLGFKKIVILGIIFVILYKSLLKFFKMKTKYKICILVGIIVFILCYLFIYILSSGNIFYDFIDNHNINTMGRVYYYKILLKYASFSPTFLGVGRNVVGDIFQNEITYSAAAGVHSDIIKMYVENGFVLFGIWCWYYLVHMTKKYRKEYDINSAIFYFIVTMYTFTLYLTDNTENYFVCQIFLITTPIVYAINRKKEIKKIN